MLKKDPIATGMLSPCESGSSIKMAKKGFGIYTTTSHQGATRFFSITLKDMFSVQKQILLCCISFFLLIIYRPLSLHLIINSSATDLDRPLVGETER